MITICLLFVIILVEALTDASGVRVGKGLLLRVKVDLPTTLYPKRG